MIFRKWGGGSKAVWNCSENSSFLVGLSVPKPSKNWSVPKKETATILIFVLWHGICMEPTMLDPCWLDDVSEPKTQYCGCVFFFTPPSHGFFFLNFHLTLTANNYGLKPLILKNYNIFRMLWTCPFPWYHPCFQQRAHYVVDVPLLKHISWSFELFHWIFCMIPHCLW